jgi:hypothetical protein
MNVIAVIVTANSCLVVEVDYVQLALDLRKRLGAAADQVRPGLPIVDDANADAFIAYLKQYQLDTADLEADWRSMSEAEQKENAHELIPTVLVDFARRRYHVSHAEADYLNLQSYVPAGWTMGETVAAEVPAPCAYWRAWPGMPQDLP